MAYELGKEGRIKRNRSNPIKHRESSNNDNKKKKKKSKPYCWDP
jgi:hypothetical protein